MKEPSLDTSAHALKSPPDAPDARSAAEKEAATHASHPADAAQPQAKDEKLLTTGEMARLTSSTLRTVRFYEEEGILRPARRTDGGHRLFDKSELDRLLFVSDLRTAGLSLDEIKEILEVKKTATSGQQASEEVRRILSERIQDLEEKLVVLTRLRDEFVRTAEIVTGCLNCNDNEVFPNDCSDCSVISTQPELPRSARVIWSVVASQDKQGAEDGASTSPSNGGTDGSPTRG
jgi:DNA-binding transcriptional MerR regulator